MTKELSNATASSDSEFSIPVSISDTTILPVASTSGSATSYSYYSGSRVTNQARNVLKKIDNSQIAHSLKKVINDIEDILSIYILAGHDITSIPPIKASISEDNAVSLDWISPDYRLGFTIEPNPSDSGWYITTSKRLNEVGGYGNLSNLDDKQITSMLINFLYANT